jgi:hypothetical protein
MLLNPLSKPEYYLAIAAGRPDSHLDIAAPAQQSTISLVLVVNQHFQRNPYRHPLQ